jgi:hypothetical protein
MSVPGHKTLAACIIAALIVCSAAAADPPDRVGRLNLITGGVWFKAGGADEWTAAALNYPLTAGDSLWTDAPSRAEVHVGSTAIRLAGGTELGFLELDERMVRMDLPQGLLNVRLRELEPGESFEILTPALSLSLAAAGNYRLEVGYGGDTRATVNEGRIEAVVAGMACSVRASQTLFVTRPDAPAVEIGKAPAKDEWDVWCAGRDRREDHLASVRYVPRSLIGCEDLDWYGSWSVSVEYGPVWAPSSLPAGWAPYRHGHWAWVKPWGWTWIDHAPWGFAPFHYGRWALLRGAWVWVPGAIPHRPVFAPALVAFTEAGAGRAVLNGKIGWFPLGPGEAYAPPYAVSQAYLKRVNVAHARSDGSQIRQARGYDPRSYTVVARQSSGEVRQVGELLGSVLGLVFSQARNAGNSPRVEPQREEPRARTPQVKNAPRDPVPQTPQNRYKVRKKKQLPNGRWAWIEEWVAQE